MRAIDNNRPVMIQALIDHGVDLNKETNEGVTVLIYSIVNNSPDLFRLFLEHGADADIAGKQSITPLMWAIVDNRPDMVRALIEHGVDLDKIDNYGYIALTYSIFVNSPDIFQLLLDHGADVNRSPSCIHIHTTIPNLHTTLFRYGLKPPPESDLLMPPEILQFEAENGYNVYGDTPLTAAIRMNDVDRVQELIQDPALDVRPTADGISPLLLALRLKRKQIFEILYLSLPRSEQIETQLLHIVQHTRTNQQGRQQHRYAAHPKQRQAYQALDPYRAFKEFLDMTSVRRKPQQKPPQDSRTIQFGQDGIASRLQHFVQTHYSPRDLQNPTIRRYLDQTRQKEQRILEKRREKKKIVSSDLPLSFQTAVQDLGKLSSSSRKRIGAPPVRQAQSRKGNEVLQTPQTQRVQRAQSMKEILKKAPSALQTPQTQQVQRAIKGILEKQSSTLEAPPIQQAQSGKRKEASSVQRAHSSAVTRLPVQQV